MVKEAHVRPLCDVGDIDDDLSCTAIHHELVIEDDLFRAFKKEVKLHEEKIEELLILSSGENSSDFNECDLDLQL